MRNAIKQFTLNKIPRIIFVNRGNLKTRMVALTFDDGPNENITERILNILNDFDIKATFFVTGIKAEQNSKIIKRIYDAGHDIGNHCYSHTKAKGYQFLHINNEILKTQLTIKRITGSLPIFFRAPYGSLGLSYFICLFLHSLKYVYWTIDMEDFLPDNHKQVLVKLKSSKIENGDIFLLHDKYQTTVKALPEIIKSARNSGFTFGKISKII